MKIFQLICHLNLVQSSICCNLNFSHLVLVCAPPGPRWNQSQGALNTTVGQPITLQAQNMPLLTNRLMQQPPLIGPGQARMTTAQQKNQPMNPTSIAASTNQPVMVATVSGASLSSQIIASKASMATSTLSGGIGTNINVLHQQPGNQQQTIGMQNLVASQSQSLPVVTASVRYVFIISSKFMVATISISCVEKCQIMCSLGKELYFSAFLKLLDLK